MKKLLSAVILQALLLSSIKAQPKLFDQAVRLKSCNISIEASRFIATTFIEMEFYNPKDEEVEGYQTFRLNKGQVITAFQLELNGKYREGSIEERWKAIRAYSAIVGKRVDPAILQMSYDNNYNIHIYPIPAHGSRKVTMTIEQLLVERNNKLNYELPMSFSSVTDTFNLKISVDNNETVPECNYGLLRELAFNSKSNIASLDLEKKDIKLNQDILFSIPLKQKGSQLCIYGENGTGKFVMRYSPDLPSYYDIQPRSISVFWDVSRSAESRNIKKEIDFLEQYIYLNKITSTTITLFNQEVRQTVAMDDRTKDFNVLRNYLLNYPCSGATNFGDLDFSNIQADAILLFSDGYSSFGKSLPAPATVQVNCIVSSYLYDPQKLYSIIGSSGGSLITLNKIEIDSAVKLISKAKNFLIKYTSKDLSVKLNEKLPMALTAGMLLSGTFTGNDYLHLVYGNTSSINRIEEIYLSMMDTCHKELYEKVMMLKRYDSVVNYGTWEDIVIFGLKEHVVTIRTSLLVLEKADDYIKYNIAPPKDLEEECAQRNYVYRSEYKIRALKSFSEQDILKQAVNNYNLYIKWWGVTEDPIDLNKMVTTVAVEQNTNASEIKQDITQTNGARAQKENLFIEGNKSNTIKEVIVTSAFGTKRSMRSQTSSMQLINSEQLNTVYNIDVNNALAGKVAGIQVRSQSGAKLGAASSIRLRGENGLGAGKGPIYIVDGTIVEDVNSINVYDIEDITVVQSVSACALFGPDASNGAIVIVTKKSRRGYYGYYPKWSDYKLKDIEDVDYITEIKNCEIDDMINVYTELEKENEGRSIFYFDMAECFYERNLKAKAVEILFEGIESCRGSYSGLKAAAYIFESWKEFNNAIKIYQDIIESSPKDMITKRDLALVYYQNGEYQKAVDTYYQIIRTDESDYYNAVQVTAMNEMNAIISMFRNCLNLGSINLNLVRQFPVDLKISLESNYGYVNNIRIIDPMGNDNAYPGQYSGNGRSFRWNNGYDYNYINDYSIKNATEGIYRVKIDSYNTYYGFAPVYLRLVVFKNFQKANQSLEVQHIGMNNQFGSVEIAEIKW